MAQAVMGAMAGGQAITGLINASNENALKKEASAFNAEISNHQATLALQESAEDERRYRIQARQQIGDMRASYGASGVTTEGSVMDSLSQAAENATLDALTIRHQGDVKAWGYRNNAKSDAFEGYVSDKLLPGRVAGALFGAGSQVASNYALRRT